MLTAAGWCWWLLSFSARVQPRAGRCAYVATRPQPNPRPAASATVGHRAPDPDHRTPVHPPGLRPFPQSSACRLSAGRLLQSHSIRIDSKEALHIPLLRGNARMSAPPMPHDFLPRDHRSASKVQTLSSPRRLVAAFHSLSQRAERTVVHGSSKRIMPSALLLCLLYLTLLSTSRLPAPSRCNFAHSSPTSPSLTNFSLNTAARPRATRRHGGPT